MTNAALASMALRARDYAYTPYSCFSVGAALLCADGTVYTGCNIESAAYSPTLCAERVAVAKAVSDGKRTFSAIAIAGGAQGEDCHYCYPCGVCRQTLAEFCGADMRILIVRTAEDFRETTFGSLLPYAFGPADLAASK